MVNERVEETVLVVDDEEMVLTSINSFLSLESDYNVKTFTSPREALDYVSNNEIGIVISDFLMPEMNGLTFLTHVRDLRPEAPRIILTGYADKENAIRAINEIGLYKYIEKPWDNDSLIKAIKDGIERQRILKRLKEKVDMANNSFAELQDINSAMLKKFM